MQLCLYLKFYLHIEITTLRIKIPDIFDDVVFYIDRFIPYDHEAIFNGILRKTK